MKQHDVIISANHFDLTESIKNIVHQKVEKLFQHESRIIRLRVELEQKHNSKSRDEFVARGLLERRGPSIVVSESTQDLYKSIDHMVSKVDRQLRRSSRLGRVKRKQPHDIDLPSQLPKVNAA